jgi:hypothetical protein
MILDLLLKRRTASQYYLFLYTISIFSISISATAEELDAGLLDLGKSSM